MPPSRKLSFVLAGLAGMVLVVFFATGAQPAALTSPLALHQGYLRQEGKRVEFTVETAKPVDTGALKGAPDTGDGRQRYLCLELRTEPKGKGARVCPGPEDRVTVTALGPGRERPVAIDAEILRPESNRLTVRVDFNRLGLEPDAYRFRFVSSDGSCGSEAGGRCRDAIPEGAGATFRLRIPAFAACRTEGGREVRNGPRDSRRVALTFDDGPGVSTRDILKILRQKQVNATFFLQSKMVVRDPETVRQIAEQGNEVANHSIIHNALPPRADIEEANREIESAAGVAPCAFRPPYGIVDAALVARARAVGLDTVLWDVDTDDWQSATTVDSILENIKENTRAGSIILMHDGGDQPRTKTVELLPRAIDLLRGEGFTPVTVSELLGNEVTWRPAGDP